MICFCRPKKNRGRGTESGSLTLEEEMGTFIKNKSEIKKQRANKQNNALEMYHKENINHTTESSLLSNLSKGLCLKRVI